MLPGEFLGGFGPGSTQPGWRMSLPLRGGLVKRGGPPIGGNGHPVHPLSRLTTLEAPPDVTAAYRIGALPRYRYVLLKDRRPRRPWQAENGLDRFARRAFTAVGAQRKTRRDLTYRLKNGRPSPWQRYRTWRKAHVEWLG